jgi:hypothetical protein
VAERRLSKTKFGLMIQLLREVKMTTEHASEFNGEQAAANFLADVQLRLVALMDSKGVSPEELANRLNVGRSRVTQMLGAGSNLTVVNIGRIFDALGEVPELTSPSIRDAIRQERALEVDQDSLLEL